MKFVPVDFLGSSDVVIIGSNPEMADYDNPQGHIYGFAPYVRIANEYGDTFVSSAGDACRCEREANEKAERMATALHSRWVNLGKLPVGFEKWQQGRAVYGSDAYTAYGADDDMALERMEEEAFF